MEKLMWRKKEKAGGQLSCHKFLCERQVYENEVMIDDRHRGRN